jgi:2-dehydropantoate 2-reductase
MRIAIYGAGGVGGYLGARLLRAGEDVVFIERGEHLHALQNVGLSIESCVHESFSLCNLSATESPNEAGRCDLIIMCVKSWQLERAALTARPMIGPHTLVLPTQNGVDASNILASVFGPRHVLCGLSRLLSEIISPGVIRHFGVAPQLDIGELDNSRSDRLEAVAATLRNAGICIEIPEDIHAALWAKLVLIAGWGGPAAVARAPLGVLRGMGDSLAMIAEAMHEIDAVARARGIELPEDTLAAAMQTLGNLPTAASTSFQRDIEAGRPSELDALCGAVTRLGREAGVPTPVNHFCQTALLPLELRARGELAFAMPGADIG